MSTLLKSFYEVKLAFRENAGKDRKVLRPDVVRQGARRTHGILQTHCMRHDGRSLRRVSSDHNSAYAKGFKLPNKRNRIGARRIAECNETDKFECRRRGRAYCKHSKTLLFQFLSNGGRVARRGG